MVVSQHIVSGNIPDVHPGGRTLRRGKHRLFLWEGREGDGSDDSTTPSKLGTRDEMGRLEKVCEQTLAVVSILTAPTSLLRSMSEGTCPSPIGSTT